MIWMVAALMLQAGAPPAPPPSPPAPPMAVRPEPARARANLASLISNEDYPAEALRNEQEGTVSFRLNVGPDGTVKNCTITRSSGHAALDSTTCRVLTERALFTPARDSLGRPTYDSVSARIVWRIEKEPELPPVKAALLVNTIRATATSGLTCLEALNGEPAETRPCAADEASDFGWMADAARAEGRTFELTMAYIIVPAGEAEPVDREEHGPQALDSEALLRIAGDGSVLDCRVVRNQAMGPAAGRDSPPSPCASFAVGKKIFEAGAEGSPAREVTIKARGYLRN